MEESFAILFKVKDIVVYILQLCSKLALSRLGEKTLPSENSMTSAELQKSQTLNLAKFSNYTMNKLM